LKVVEGIGLFANRLDNPHLNASFPGGFERQAVDKAIAPGSLPLPALPQETPAVTPPSGNSSARDLSPTENGRKSKEEDVWNTGVDDPQVKTLLAPTLFVPLKHPGFIGVESMQTLSYLEPLGNDNYHLKRTDGKKLGMKFTVEVQPVEGDVKCVDASLEIETTALDGREAVDGLDLDVGKPIITTRSLKTTVRMKLGAARVVAIPSRPSTEAVLLLRVKGFEPPKKN
jgi:hypothetical protein